MDIATLIGLLGVSGILVGQILMGGTIDAYIDVPSLIGTLGGSIMVLFINFSLPQVLKAAQVAKNSFQTNTVDTTETLKSIVAYAETARKQGMLALEEPSESEKNVFMRKCLRLAVDGTDPKVLSRILEVDIEQVENRHIQGQDIFLALGQFAPAFGMIGTLIGLVKMLSGLEDPSTIGAGMAVALLTTFYGAVIANTFALPMAGKLKVRSDEEVNLRWMMVEGIMAIQSGDSPRVVEEKLKGYLTPSVRVSLEKEREEAEA
ncbi:MotA/TolQ/ExbB proton channel family protein [bacterium]|nr:MotA/TolQ/ExbB proton channel family protein [bacterium]